MDFVLPQEFATMMMMATATVLEGAPFILLGALLSALIEVFVSNERMFRLVPRHTWLQSLAGLGFGFVLPACECGIVPIVSRLMKRGVPSRMALTCMLAAPAINPLALLSTYVGFQGNYWMVFGRVGLTIICATAVGLLLSRFFPSGLMKEVPVEGSPCSMTAVATTGQPCCSCAHHHANQQRSRFVDLCCQTATEFIEMGKLLILGGLAAALFRVYLWAPASPFLEGDLFVEVGMMMLLAMLLSVCSEADSFVAAAFWSFGAVAQLAFISIGPMVDLKLAIAYIAVFKPRASGLLIVLPVLLVYALSAVLAVFFG